MRSWFPLSPKELDRKRLLGEHLELHCIAKIIYNINNNLPGGYKKHPEVLRWVGHTKALAKRHEIIVEEMRNRGYNHKSGLDIKLINISDTEEFPENSWEPLEVMKKKLADKILTERNKNV